MAWLDLEADLAELFAEAGEADEAALVRFEARLAARRPPPHSGRLPPPASRLGRVVAAIIAGAHTPLAIAATASLDITDVRHDLQNLRRTGRVRRGAKGWIL